MSIIIYIDKTQIILIIQSTINGIIRNKMAIKQFENICRHFTIICFNSAILFLYFIFIYIYIYSEK